MHSFSSLPPSSLPANGAKSGHSFTSLAIHPVTYLRSLLSQAKGLGAKTISTELPTSSGFAHAVGEAMRCLNTAGGIEKEGEEEKEVVVVNCTGLGAHSLCKDASMYPIRGQALLARIHPTPAPQILLHESPPHITYIVPRMGTDLFLLGGTKDADNWSGEPTPEISESIVRRCEEMMRPWAGEEAKIEVLSEQVGLRPGRKGGVRVEIEEVEVGEGRKVKVVHQYGHAGAGYQNAIGSARKVLGIVKDILS